MEVHIYSVKARRQAGNMSQIYNDNIKMLTLQSLRYIEDNNETGKPIWKYATGTLRSW